MVGTEIPFDQRFRIGLSFDHRSDAVGKAGVNRIALREEKLELRVAWFPVPSVLLYASMPYVHRAVEYVNGGTESVWRPGDAALQGRWYFFRDRDFAPRHLLAVSMGARLPTGPLSKDADGRYLPPELQTGVGGVELSLGPTYSAFDDALSYYVSVLGVLPVASRLDAKPGPSLRLTAAAQWQPETAVALRGVIDARVDSRVREQGAVDPDSGGFVLFVGPDMVFSLGGDLLAVFGFRVPAVNALHGNHDEGVSASLSIVYDL